MPRTWAAGALRASSAAPKMTPAASGLLCTPRADHPVLTSAASRARVKRRAHREPPPPSTGIERSLLGGRSGGVTICCSSIAPAPASAVPAMDAAEGIRPIKLAAIPATPESLAPFGQLVLPGEDGDEFGAQDADLDLSRGKPRVYIMRLRDRKLGFDNITHHASVTQCLGAVGGGVWYLGLCAASVVDPRPPEGDAPAGYVRSRVGHWYRPPKPEDVVVVRMEGPAILKLNAGTWHAGPLFTQPVMDFFNLELADTNVVDHTTHDFAAVDRVAFEFDA